MKTPREVMMQAVVAEPIKGQNVQHFIVPKLEKAIRAAIEQVRREEREACAVIASERSRGVYYGDCCESAAQACAYGIAVAIRARKK